jgi:dCTP deaminase
MATLVDWQLMLMCEEENPLLSPFDPKYINPASIDITLGDILFIEGRVCGPEGARSRWLPVDLYEYTEDNPFKLPPANFILGHTHEIVRVPDWAESHYHLKSSLARDGLEHLNAGYIDPGWYGQLTLEMLNVNQRHDICPWAGMRIGQLRFCRLDAVPAKTYAETGRYMNDMGVQPSRGIKVD